MRLAINGFGRIGRAAFKIAVQKKGIVVAAINDLADAPTLAHLLQYDSTYGRFSKTVRAFDRSIIVDGRKILVLSQKDPTQLPWGKLNIDVVIESTGRFTDLNGASQHLTAGAKRVIISAPAKGGEVPTVVLGVNHKSVKSSQYIVSNASCTTNCISPVMEVLQRTIGVVKATMTTIHSYTADQNLQDGAHKDLRRARAAAYNIVPTTTGAAIATTETIPSLKGKFDGLSIRVPTPVVSLSDITVVVSRKTTIEEVNHLFVTASKQQRYRGILAVTDLPLVSTDFIGNPYSAVVDATLTSVIDGDLVKVIAWYDNEWGYSHRLIELAMHLARH